MPHLSLVKQIEPFNLLTEEELQEIAPFLDEVSFPKGQYIFQQGEPSKQALFIVLSGTVEVIVTNEKGIDTVMGLRKKGEFFGETVILTDKTYPASVKPVEDVVCLRLAKQHFELLLYKNAAFSGYFNQILTERLRGLFHEVVLEQSYEAYGIDTQPFRKRVVDIMSTPVITCNEKDSITTIARKLVNHRISSLVVLDEAQRPVGLVSEGDLVKKVLTPIPPQTHLTAKEIMNPELPVLTPDAFFYQALLNMIKNRSRQMVIIDEDKLMGIITIGDLIKTRSTGTLTMVDNIESQDNIQGLVSASIEVNKVLTALVAEKAPITEICEIITELNDRLTRRVIEISEEEMLHEGYGPPPVKYCFLNMGSSGRREQTLRTDQDNAIIYENFNEAKNPEVKQYFQILAEKIIDGLESCGFARCPGNIMAVNPYWNRSISDWQDTVSRWFFQPNPEIIRNFTIFLDFRPVYGQRSLAELLRKFILVSFKEQPTILQYMAKDAMDYRVPIGIFKGFITEKTKEHKGEIDLKKAACVHMVDCIRIFAMQEGLTETNTLDRLQKLMVKGVIPLDDAEFYETAYLTLMTFRNRENLRKASRGLPADNYINPNLLSKREHTVLKEAFLATDRLQIYLGNVYRLVGY